MDSYDVIRKRKENEKTTEDSMIYSCWNQYKQHRSLNIGERYSFYFLAILAFSIDYILLSKSLLPSLLESTILNTSSSLSDHAAICCSLSLVCRSFPFSFIRRWRRACKPFVLLFIISKWNHSCHRQKSNPSFKREIQKSISFYCNWFIVSKPQRANQMIVKNAESIRFNSNQRYLIQNWKRLLNQSQNL